MTGKGYRTVSVIKFACLECGKQYRTPKEAADCRKSDLLDKAYERILSGEDPDWIECEAEEVVEFDGHGYEVDTEPVNPASEQDLEAIFHTETGRYGRTVVWRKKTEVPE